MDIKDFRQPMVTSLGVLLGFLIGFLGQWVTEGNFSLATIADKAVFAGCNAGVVLLVLALFSVLWPISPDSDVRKHYKRCLTFYGLGVVVAFASIVLSPFI